MRRFRPDFCAMQPAILCTRSTPLMLWPQPSAGAASKLGCIGAKSRTPCVGEINHDSVMWYVLLGLPLPSKRGTRLDSTDDLHINRGIQPSS